MNGATADPWAKMINPPSSTITTMIGASEAMPQRVLVHRPPHQRNRRDDAEEHQPHHDRGRDSAEQDAEPHPAAESDEPASANAASSVRSLLFR